MAAPSAIDFLNAPDAPSAVDFLNAPDEKPSASDAISFLNSPSDSDSTEPAPLNPQNIDELSKAEESMANQFSTPKPIVSGGGIHLGNIASHVLSKWVDTLNTATGSDADANKDPEILKLREKGDSPIVSLPKPSPAGAVSGAVRGIENTVEKLTTPENAVIMGALGGAPALVQKVAAAGFGVMMAHDAPAKIQEAMDEPTSAGKAEKITEGIADAVMAFGALKHAAGRGGRLATGVNMPTSLPDWIKKETGHEIVQSNPSPASVDGLLLAKEKAGEGFFDLSSEEQSNRRQIIEEIDNQLAGMPKDAVKAGEERVAQRDQSKPPAEGEAPPVTPGGPPEKSGSAGNWKQANEEAGATTEQSPSDLTKTIYENSRRALEATKDIRIGDQSLHEWGRDQLAKNPSKTAFAVELQKMIPGFDLQTGKAIAGALGREDVENLVKPLPEAPGAATATEDFSNTLPPTGLKRAVVYPERVDRGAETIPTPETQPEDQVVKDAHDRLYNDPTLAKALVARIVDEGDKSISEHDAAELLVERRQVMNERNDWETRLGNGEDVEVAKTRLAEIENELDRLDRAQRSAGTQWGRIGHLYQREIRDDFSLEGMKRKARAAKQGPLSEDELAAIKKQSEEIEKYQSELDKAAQEHADAQLDADTQATHDALVEDLKKPVDENGQKIDSRILGIAEKIVKGLENQADSALKRIRARRSEGRVNSLPVDDLIDYSIYGAAKIARKGLDFTKWSAEMVKDFGDMSAGVLKQVWDASHTRIDELGKKTGKDAEKVTKALRKKSAQTPDEAKAAAKAEAVAGEPLSHKVVFDYVKALIQSGVHGVDTLMKAAHEGLKEHFPELTERDVRRAFSEYGKAKFPSKDAVKVELAETRRITQLQESIDRLKEGQDPLKSGLQRDKATQQIREKQKELNELLKKHAGPPSPEKLDSRDQAKQTALRNAIEDIDKQLRTGEKPAKGAPIPDSTQTEQLRAERDAMKAKLDEIEAENNPPKSPEEKYNDTRLKQVEKRTAELEAKIKAGDFSKPSKPVPLPKSVAVKNAEFKLAQAKKRFNQGVFEAALKNRSTTRKILEGGRDVLNTARAAMTSFDLSAVLRQGGFISLGHPIRALKAFPAMFRALASEKGEFELNKEIQSRPNAELYQQSKLHLNDPDNPHLSKMEEAYMSRWARKIPGISHSERAYNGFLNRLRADSFDAMVESLGKKPTPEEAKAIANFVNVATGRGNLGSVAGGAISLNTAFFAPKYVASRFELLAGAPLYRGTAATRIAVAKEYARFLGGIGVVYALSQAAGATVESDPRSSDFGKLKFGKTRLDPLSGLSQATTLLARLTTGKTKTDNGIKSIRGPNLPFGQSDTADVAGRFLRSKLSPIMGAAFDASSGKSVTGQPVTPAQAAARLLAPLSFGDIADAMKDQGIAKGSALALLSLLGWGVQRYDDHRSSSRN